MTNFAYTRYSLIHPEIEAKQAEYENEFQALVKNWDDVAQKMWNDEKQEATIINYLSSMSLISAQRLVDDWKKFYKYLFVKYMDGNVKTPREVPAGYKYYAPKVEWPGYDEKWMRSVVNDAGDKLKVPSENK